MSPIKKYSKKSKTQKGGTRGHSTVHPESHHNHPKKSKTKLVEGSLTLQPIYAWGESENSPEYLGTPPSNSTANDSNSSSPSSPISDSSGSGSYKEFEKMSRRYNASEQIIKLAEPELIRPRPKPHPPSKGRHVRRPKHPINRASKVAPHYIPSRSSNPGRRGIQQKVTPKMTRVQLLGEEMPKFNENTIHEERHRDLNPIKNAIKSILGHKQHNPEYYNLSAKDIKKLQYLLNQDNFSEEDIEFVNEINKDIEFNTRFPTKYSNNSNNEDNSENEDTVSSKKHTSSEEDPRVELLKAIKGGPKLRHVEHPNTRGNLLENIRKGHHTLKHVNKRNTHNTHNTKKINTRPTLGRALLERVPKPERGSNSNSGSGSNSEWKN